MGSASLGKLRVFSLRVPLLARVKHLTTEISRKPLDRDASGRGKLFVFFFFACSGRFELKLCGGVLYSWICSIKKHTPSFLML